MNPTKTIRGKGPEYGFERGRCLPDVAFVTVQGVRKRLSDFKDRNNLVVILTGQDGDELPAALAAEDAAIRRHDGHVIAILPGISPEAHRWPFDVVEDPDGAVRRKLSPDGSTQSHLTVYITDRWGEVVFACRTEGGDPAPAAAGLLDWLKFVDHLCPECFPPEWPA